MALRGYLCARATEEPHIDGDVSKPFWSQAPWTEDFVDILGDSMPKPRFRTRVKMLWDDQHLYIAAEMEEPHVWGTITERDEVIFHDNDFEIFLDPDGDNHLYAEIEINALGTVWDLLLVKPYRDGGPALTGWDIKGLQSAVRIYGTLNDPTDIDTGWTVEMAIPWVGIKEIAQVPCPPRIGDQWRINFSRVQWEHTVEDGRYRKVPNKPEDNWVWSPQPSVDMHRPEAWGTLEFASEAGNCRALDDSEERQSLMDLYYRQKAYYASHGRYANAEEVDAGNAILTSSAAHWCAQIGEWQIDSTSRLTRSLKK